MMNYTQVAPAVTPQRRRRWPIALAVGLWLAIVAPLGMIVYTTVVKLEGLNGAARTTFYACSPGGDGAECEAVAGPRADGLRRWMELREAESGPVRSISLHRFCASGNRGEVAGTLVRDKGSVPLNMLFRHEDGRWLLITLSHEGRGHGVCENVGV